VSAALTSRSVLRRGDTGTAVQDLQRKLGVRVDGSFGPDTESALKEFQSISGLDVVGIADKETNEKLFSDAGIAETCAEFREDE